MRLEVFAEPEVGTSYAQLRDLARHAEALGFDGFYCSDHFLGSRGQRPPGPVDAWTTLAGLALETSRLRLGTLVSPVTFRLPGVLAVVVAQVDAMSGGRVDLGLGAGHMAVEHAGYGIPFPDLGTRFDMLEEQLAIVRGLWATPEGETFSFTGRHYRLEDCPARPKPVQQPHPHIIVGGRGPKRTPLLAARFADEINVSYVPPPVAKEGYDRSWRACEAIGRDPATLHASSTALLCCADNRSDLERRRDYLSRGADPAKRYPGVADVEGFAAVGTPEVVVERLLAYREAGAERVFLHIYDFADLDHLSLVAGEVLPHVR